MLFSRHSLPRCLVFVSLAGVFFVGSGCGDTGIPNPSRKDSVRGEQPRVAKIQDLTAEAENLKAKGRYAEAVAVYEKIVAAQPDQAEPYVHLGALYFNLGIHAKAEEYYLKAIDRDSRSPELYFHLGYIKESEGKLQEALEWYLKAEEKGVASAELFFNIGNVFARLANADRAIEYYKKAVAVNPRSMDAFVNLSVISFQQGAYFDAEFFLDKAVALGYQEPQGYREAIAAKMKEPAARN